MKKTWSLDIQEHVSESVKHLKEREWVGLQTQASSFQTPWLRKWRSNAEGFC